MAHVASLIGLPDLALRFAQRSLAIAVDQSWDGWRLASAHEGMARACTAAGDREARSVHLALAEAALGREPNTEDAAAIREQLSSVPEVPISP